MLTRRIIPCLDVRSGRVVKGVKFTDIRDAGDPVELAAFYDAGGADEICFLDIDASYEARRAILDTISRTAEQVFIPLTVGGGVNAPEDVGQLLRAGADKVSINSGAVRNPDLILNAALAYGAQCIVVAIDVKASERVHCGWEVFVQGGRKATGLDALEWCLKATELGAGEILLTSMDADGTKAGYDLRVTELLSSSVRVPLIASGGAGTVEHVVEVFSKTSACAALLASILHYGEASISAIKDSLSSRDIPVRPLLGAHAISP